MLDRASEERSNSLLSHLYDSSRVVMNALSASSVLKLLDCFEHDDAEVLDRKHRARQSYSPTI